MSLLAIDVGNSNTVFGLFKGKKLQKTWRSLSTPQAIEILFKKLPRDISGIIISSVVPSLNPLLKKLSQKLFQIKPMIVDYKMNMPIRLQMKNPQTVGPDRIVNAVAAYARWKTALIVIDIGTATTFDAITADGKFIGGAITPGPGTINDALAERCELLPRVPLQKPKHAIGRETLEVIRSGVFLGYVGLIEGLIDRFQKELGSAKVIATGGLSALFAKSTKLIDVIEPNLTLQGLRLLYEQDFRD